MMKKLHKDKNKHRNRDKDVVYIKAVVDLDKELADVTDTTVLSVKKKFQRIVIAVVCVMLLGSGVFFVYDRAMTYSSVSTKQVYPVVGVASSQFEDFSKGIIKYGRDGAVHLDYKGREIWNQGYQISNPIIETTNKSAAIADGGGNNIYVFDESGFKGQIETNLPIEKFSVSEQGVVAVLVKGAETAGIICYDAVGNILVEHSASSGGMGYPTDVAISSDGKLLLVTYLQIVEGEIIGRVVFYDFEHAGMQMSDYVVATEERTNVVMPTAYFADDETAVVITDVSFMVFRGGTPTLVVEAEVDKAIKSVAYDDAQVAFVLEGDGEYENEIRVYDTSGELVMSQMFDGQYSHMKLQGNQVLMYEGNQCKMFTIYGKEKFDGEFTDEILSVTKVFGVNTYVAVSEEGMKKVQLRK